MSYFRPWESSTSDNSQQNQQRTGADSIQINLHGNSVNSLQTNQHRFSNDELLDTYVSTNHLQVVTRLAKLMNVDGSVAQQLHRFYIESLAQLQSSSSRTSSRLQDAQQSSKQQYEDLFIIVQKQCEVLEDYIHGHIKNGITGPRISGSIDGESSEESDSKQTQRKKAKPNPKVRRRLFQAK